jgi:uncharacterized protein (DUF342 family)
VSDDQKPQRLPERVGSALAAAGTVGTRAWDFISRLATLTKEQERHSQRLDKLTDQMVELAKDVQRIAGKLDGIEKRFDDKDKYVEAVIALRIKEEIDRLRAELK